MATFIWPSEVRWPPPAHVLLNYDVAQPDAPQPAEKGVLRSPDVVQLTHGALRVTEITIPPPPDPIAALDDRVAALEAQVVTLNQQMVDVQDLLAQHDQRLADIEALVNTPPTVVDETATVLTNSLQVGVIVRTMQASGDPTAWEITDETRNGLPTTGYWLIDAAGAVSPTQAGIAGIAKHNNVEIQVRATNPYGTGDGKLDINFN